MAKYCTKCGKKLGKEEVCSCMEKNSTSSITDEIKEFLMNPLDVLEKGNRKSENSYIICLLTALSFGIISFLIPSMSRYFFYANMISTTILVFVFFLFFSLIIQWLENSFFKGNLTFEKVYGVISKSSISLLIGNIVSFFVYFISIKVSILIFLFSILLFVIYNFYGVMKLSNTDKNKIPYLYGISVFVTMIVGCLLLVIL